MQTLISEDQLREEIARFAARIDRDYAGKPLTLVGLLNGSVIFLADLIRRLTIPVQFDTVRTSSYRDAVTQPGELWIDPQASPRVAGRHVLLIDDIFDTGQTLLQMKTRAGGWGAASVRTTALLWKRSRSLPGAAPDEFLFEIPDLFVVGYGLDYNGAYRQLPMIAVLDDSDATAALTPQPAT